MLLWGQIKKPKEASARFLEERIEKATSIYTAVSLLFQPGIRSKVLKPYCGIGLVYNHYNQDYISYLVSLPANSNKPGQKYLIGLQYRISPENALTLECSYIKSSVLFSVTTLPDMTMQTGGFQVTAGFQFKLF